jgi:hypothetical protein
MLAPGRKRPIGAKNTTTPVAGWPGLQGNRTLHFQSPESCKFPSGDPRTGRKEDAVWVDAHTKSRGAASSDAARATLLRRAHSSLSDWLGVASPAGDCTCASDQLQRLKPAGTAVEGTFSFADRMIPVSLPDGIASDRRRNSRLKP